MPLEIVLINIIGLVFRAKMLTYILKCNFSINPMKVGDKTNY